MGFEQAETVPLAGTVYERVLRTQQVDVQELAEGAHLIVPVADRGDAIGVIELTLPQQPDEQAVATIAATAHALAYVVIANRRHTDLFEWGQCTTPFSLAAEIQRRLLPPYTCEAGQFTLAGWLEPARTVGGDTFDYNLNREALQLSITDAVGHQVEAALLATLLVGSLRNGRRRGLNLKDQAGNADDVSDPANTPEEVSTSNIPHSPLRTTEDHAVAAKHHAQGLDPVGCGHSHGHGPSSRAERGRTDPSGQQQRR